MSVPLVDLVEPLRADIALPDSPLYDLDDDYMIVALKNAFWLARLDGLLGNYGMNSSDEVVPLDGGEEIPGEYLALIQLYAALNIVNLHLRNLGTGQRYKAGPVEYETQNSAQVMKEILSELRARKNWVLTRLSTLAGGTSDIYIDAVAERLNGWDTYWVG